MNAKYSLQSKRNILFPDEPNKNNPSPCKTTTTKANQQNLCRLQLKIHPIIYSYASKVVVLKGWESLG